MGELIDHGWNILLFPEGKLTTTGEMDRFKSGIGLLAQAMQVPVVPIRLDGLYECVNYEGWTPKKFGHPTITFGRQMRVDMKAAPDAIARQLESAVRSLP